MLVADPEVFRKRTHEPHGNAMKKKQKAASPTKSKYTKKLYKSLQHAKSKQPSQNITTEAEYYNISKIKTNHLRLNLERLKQLIKSNIRLCQI